jgi:hypothetical protein
MKKPDEFVLALSASSPAEAEIVRMILEGEGLVVLISDRNMPLPVDLTPLDGDYQPAGCQVLVAAKDAERARKVIAEAREGGQFLSDQEMPSETEGDGDGGE